VTPQDRRQRRPGFDDDRSRSCGSKTLNRPRVAPMAGCGRGRVSPPTARQGVVRARNTRGGGSCSRAPLPPPPPHQCPARRQLPQTYRRCCRRHRRCRRRIRAAAAAATVAPVAACTGRVVNTAPYNLHQSKRVDRPQ